MAEAIGLLNNLPVKIEDNVLQVGASPSAPLHVTSDASSPLSVSAAHTIERVSLDLTTTDGAYDAQDVIGGLLTFPLPKAGWTQLVLYIYDEQGDGAAINVYAFDSEPASIIDNEPIVISAADVSKLMTVALEIAMSGVMAGGGPGFTSLTLGPTTMLGTGFPPAPFPGDTLYVYLTVGGAGATLTSTSGFKVALVAVG